MPLRNNSVCKHITVSEHHDFLERIYNNESFGIWTVHKCFQFLGKKSCSVGSWTIISHICLSSLAPSSWLSSSSIHSMGTERIVNKLDDTFQQPWPLHYLALPNNVLLCLGTGSFNERIQEPLAPACTIRACCLIKQDTCTVQVFGGRPLDIWWVGESFPLLQMQRGIAEEGCHYWGPDMCQACPPSYLQFL